MIFSQVYEIEYQAPLGNGFAKQCSSQIVYKNQNSSNVSKSTDDFRDFLRCFTNTIATMAIKQEDLNEIFRLSGKLAREMKDLNDAWFRNENPRNLTPTQVTDITCAIATDHLSTYDSAYKRNKIVISSSNFVMPKEQAVGVRWEKKKHVIRGKTIRIPRMIQSTLQYVPIMDTLRSLFADEIFRNIYLKYNETINNSKLVTDPNSPDYIYCNFNSGSAFKNNVLFKENPMSIQIQIGCDDFEICSPLQSKSNIYKICGLYFTIQNLPEKYLSKSNNIYLVCLCSSDDLKSEHTDFNNIWQLLVNDLEDLETFGIEVPNYGTLKGTMATTAFDNLGANTSLGYAGFSSEYYCRNCETPKTLCKQLTSERECTMRTRESYEESLRIISEVSNVVYRETKGVKFYCELSNLKYFHIIDNPIVDLMHDLNEGLIPKLLEVFFRKFIEENIVTQQTLDEITKQYDFGILNGRNIPCAINFDKRNLGQNASQSICLIRHLPFILHKFKDNRNMKMTWECLQSLLRISEILYSSQIEEHELKRLEIEISKHLTKFKKISRADFSCKQHFLLHYPRIIRTIGPPIHYSMMRYERKHKDFKTFRNSTNNFKAINKSLAMKHQKRLSQLGFSYNDKIEHGLIIPLQTDEMLQHWLKLKFGEKELASTKFIKINSYQYREGLVILIDRCLYEIRKILYVENEFHFACNQLDVLELNEFFNSFQVKLNNINRKVIAFKCLIFMKTYEKKFIQQDEYIIADTLELRRNVEIKH